MQETSGIIKNCADWKDRRWQQVCGITLKEVRRECDLWRWDEPHLIIAFYPVEKEKIVQEKRALGSLGGRPRNNHTVNHTVIDKETERLTVSGNGREGKGIGKEVPPKPPLEGVKKRINAIFKRPETKAWSYEEERAFGENQIEDEELCLIENFYSATIPKDEDRRRRSLIMLLTNWNGETDKARSWKSNGNGQPKDKYFT